MKSHSSVINGEVVHFSDDPGPEINFLGDLTRLELKPGDRFVLQVPGPISHEDAGRLQHMWRHFVGGDAEELRLFIIERGMTLGVINVGPKR